MAGFGVSGVETMGYPSKMSVIVYVTSVDVCPMQHYSSPMIPACCSHKLMSEEPLTLPLSFLYAP